MRSCGRAVVRSCGPAVWRSGGPAVWQSGSPAFLHSCRPGVNDQVHAVLEKSGFYELLGKENICSNINEALEVAAKEVKEL